MADCTNKDGRPARTRGLCAACYMRYLERQKAYGRFESLYVDAQPARDHVIELLDAGLSRHRVAQLAGLNRKAITYLLDGRKERGHGPNKEITRVNADKFLAVPVPARPVDTAAGAALVDSIGTIRRLRALVAFGWPAEHLADQLSGEVSACTVHELVRGARTECLARTARSVARLFDRLQLTPGPSQRSRNTGLKRKWAVPLQWDEDTIDDLEALPVPAKYRALKPKSAHRVNHEVRESRVQAVAELTRVNKSAAEIAVQLRISQRQVVRYRGMAS
ncbi:hypothetical protein CH296_00515 [Rhodococcus sp. 14-2496-1d]|uniref:hypothetical protein n=1 Tax=Rhodococcus sp. 14-2496-1d TaxID=2023146 RepID=UPI000B9C74E7|nr:hypothetical protein [Rhodococcus sp. 14-2496-1d]OZF40773.1 hypothetical protein CH296_00515 [Rhodococcus sp. 14-2496-1d]